MAKALTREQVEGRKAKAARFVDTVLGDSDRADEIENESLEDYAARRGFALTNPRYRRRNNCMPQTKADLQEVLDSIEDILNSAYTPESSREDLAAAVGDALDAISGEDEDSNGNGDDDDDGD